MKHNNMQKINNIISVLNDSEFFEILYGNCREESFLNLWTLSNKMTHSFPIDDLSEAYKRAKKLAKTDDVYFGVGLREFASFDGISRGTEKDVGVLPGLWFDIDVKGENHKKQSLPENDSDVKNILNAIPLKSTLIIDTGGGLHLYWLFEEPWILKDDKDRVKAKELSVGFQNFIISEGKKHGFNLDNTADIARVLRIPGTYNHKSKSPKKVGVKEYNEDYRYTISDFEKYQVKKEVRKRASANIPDTIPDGERNDTLARLAGSMRHDGMNENEIAASLMTINDNRCSPPLPEDEVRQIAASVSKYPPASKAKYVKNKLTDYGNAERLVAKFGEISRYCYALKNWFCWDGKKWKKDDTGEIVRRTKATVRSIEHEVNGLTDTKEMTDILSHAKASEAEPRINRMINLAKSEKGISVMPDEMDADPWLLNCENGIVDLKTGKLLPHDKDKLITKIVPVEYDPDATCPTFLEFLDKIMNGNPALVQFLQRAIGYALTGDMKEQCIFLLYGTGSNGKSTFLEVLRDMFNDYVQQTAFDTFLSKKNDRVRNDLAGLKGARLVTAVEVESGETLSEMVVKQITGGDPITARFLFGEYFEFHPTFKVFLATNHKPVIRGTDNGIWRRIKLVPFEVTFKGDDEFEENEILQKDKVFKKDKNLKDKLSQELPGILKWAIDGCLEWQKTGLQAPDEVKQATKTYREDMDVLIDFISARCEIKASKLCPTKELYEAYKQYCSDNDEKPLGKQKFHKKMEERGFNRLKKNSKDNWENIRLKTEDDAIPPV